MILPENQRDHTMQCIKNIAKQKQNYKYHWQAINDFIDEDRLAAFIADFKATHK